MISSMAMTRLPRRSTRPTTGPSWARQHPSKAPRCRYHAVESWGAPVPLTGLKFGLDHRAGHFWPLRIITYVLELVVLLTVRCFAQFIAVCSKSTHHRMRQHPCLNRCAPTRSPVNTCRGHVRGYHVSRTIYDKHIVSLYSPLEPVHRVHILAHAVRPSLLLSGGLAGMFPHAFAAGLLLLSTFLRCYKLL